MGRPGVPTIGWTDVLPCVFVCVWGRYPPAAALLVRRLVVPVLNKLLQLPLHPLVPGESVRRPPIAKVVLFASEHSRGRRAAFCRLRGLPT